MTRIEFLIKLEESLASFRIDDKEKTLEYYSEMIQERTEDGMDEEDVVAMLGSPDEVVAQIIAEMPISQIVKQRIKKKKRRLKGWEIALLAIGSPIWASLLIVALAVILVLYVVTWALVISVWAIFASLAACGLGGIAAGVGIAVGTHYVFAGIALVGAGVFCAGASIFAFFGCRAATKGIVRLTHKCARSMKRRMMRKGEKV